MKIIIKWVSAAVWKRRVFWRTPFFIRPSLWRRWKEKSGTKMEKKVDYATIDRGHLNKNSTVLILYKCVCVFVVLCQDSHNIHPRFGAIDASEAQHFLSFAPRIRYEDCAFWLCETFGTSGASFEVQLNFKGFRTKAMTKHYMKDSSDAFRLCAFGFIDEWKAQSRFALFVVLKY